MTRPRSLSGLLALAALLAALPAQAQRHGALPEDAADRLLEHAQSRLGLTEDQKALVADALEDHQPGALWTAAAALATTLTDEQRARLTERPALRVRPDAAERPDRPRRGERPRGPRGERPDRAERPDYAERQQAMEAAKAARNEALGLSAAQAADLDRLDEERREAFRERVEAGERPERPSGEHGPLPEAVADVLTPEQETVWLVHHALRPHHGRRWARGPRH